MLRPHLFNILIRDLRKQIYSFDFVVVVCYSRISCFRLSVAIFRVRINTLGRIKLSPLLTFCLFLGLTSPLSSLTASPNYLLHSVLYSVLACTLSHFVFLTHSFCFFTCVSYHTGIYTLLTHVVVLVREESILCMCTFYLFSNFFLIRIGYLSYNTDMHFIVDFSTHYTCTTLNNSN